MSSPTADESGMTLIELLISVAVMMLIVGPIVMVLQFGLASSVAGSQRTTDSAGAQLLASYLPADVQSASLIWTPDSPTAFASPFANRCGNDDTRIELQSRNAETGQVLAVTYDLVPGDPAGSSPAFARRSWSAATSPCLLVESSTLVRAVDPDAPPLASCVPALCAAAHTVDVTITAFSSDVHNSSLYDTYTYELTGSRRSE